MPGAIVARAVVTACLLAGPLLATPGLPAVAAEPAPTACPPGEGVAVVVDPGALGGPVRSSCAPGDGTAAEVLEAAGVVLQRVAPFPGFVCRVDGRPVGADCSVTPPADGYWGLFSAAGDDTGWTYATVGLDSLRVPAGGSLAWAWQDGGELEMPRTDPAGGPQSTGSAGDPVQEPDVGLPAWTTVVVLTALGGAVAGALVLRRRSRTS